MRVFSTPGVYRREIDLSEIFVSNGISNGGIVIRSPKGPIRRPVLVSNDKEFIEYFGEPVFVSGSSDSVLIPEYGYGSYGALEFLKQSTSLFVVRAFDPTDKYAAIEVDNDLSSTDTDLAVGGGILSLSGLPVVFDKSDTISSIDDVTLTEPLLISSISPGIDGNDISVTIETLHPNADWLYKFDDYPTDVSATIDGPLSIWTTGTSGDIDNYFPIASKVFKVKVYKKPSNKTWDDMYSNDLDEADSKLRIGEIESYYGSLSPLLDSNKKSLYIEDIINGKSKSIYVKANSGQILNYSYTFSGTSGEPYLPDGDDDGGYFVNSERLYILSGGSVTQSNGLDSSDDIFWPYFNDRQELPIQILIGTSYNTTTKQTIGEVVANRLDCIATVQAGELDDLTYQDILDSEKYGYIEPSYVSIYGGYSKIYDRNNDKYIYLPNSIYGAMLFARTDNVASPWNAPAGLDRGMLAVFDQLKVYNDDHIGKLYNRNINMVKYIKNAGFAMWGQKTAQLKKSALDRIQVRRTLLYIENNIEQTLFQYTFENNTDQTRLRIWSNVTAFLDTIGEDGLYSKEVVCDTTNNTPTVIDNNQINLDIYLQPTKSAEFIQFTTVVTKTGISFSDVKLKYA